MAPATQASRLSVPVFGIRSQRTKGPLAARGSGKAGQIGLAGSRSFFFPMKFELASQRFNPPPVFDLEAARAIATLAAAAHQNRR
jgi:hypothetical protein